MPVSKDPITGKPTTAAVQPNTIVKLLQGFLDLAAIIGRLVTLAWVTEQLLNGPSQLQSIKWMAEAAPEKLNLDAVIKLHHARWAARAAILAASAVQLAVYAWAVFAARRGKRTAEVAATAFVIISAVVLAVLQYDPERYGLPSLDMFELSLIPLIVAAGTRIATAASCGAIGMVVAAEILMQAVLADSRGTDPFPLLRVAPGLARLRRLVLHVSMHPRFCDLALERNQSSLRERLIESREPAAEGDQFDNEDCARSEFYGALLCASRGPEELGDWIESTPRLRNTTRLIEVASAHNNDEALDWLRESDFIEDEEYSERALDEAFCSRSWDAVDWWRRSGLTPKFTKRAFPALVERDDFGLIEWLDREGPRGAMGHPYNGIGHPHELGQLALVAGSYEIVKRLSTHKLYKHWIREAEWYGVVMDLVKTENVRSLRWVYYEAEGYGFYLEDMSYYSELWQEAVECASKHNKLASLGWLAKTFHKHGFECPASWADVNPGDNEDQVVARLNWWLQAGVPLQVDLQALNKAVALGYNRVFEWWMGSGLVPEYQ
ncbi:hypothetical protein H9P43_009427 [Blastocladiella emersonii ATCC 22665]|nr:hypothetical protein H9P43_009427 [Blastocladiella emersonii ATCC 22665]